MRKTHVRPSVAVLVAVHNGATYLEETLQSIDGQNYENLDVVICDDGSSDDSLDRIYSFARNARHRVSILKHSTAMGPTAAFFSCARYASEFADLLTFFSHDDVMRQGHVSSVVRASKPGTVLVSGIAHLVDDQDRRIGTTFCPPRLQIFGSALSGFLFARNMVIAVGATIPASAVDHMDSSSPFHVCEDWERWLRLAPQGKFRLTTRASVMYRIHATNLHHSLTQSDQSVQYREMRRNLLGDQEFRDLLPMRQSALGKLGLLLGRGLWRFSNRDPRDDCLWNDFEQARVAEPSTAKVAASSTEKLPALVLIERQRGDGSGLTCAPDAAKLEAVTFGLMSWLETGKMLARAFVGLLLTRQVERPPIAGNSGRSIDS